MAKVGRTVKYDLTVTIEGEDWEPLGQHAEALMRGWVGRRVQVEDANYWGTRKHAALMLPAHDVMAVATLHAPMNKPNEVDENDNDN